jgi:hypothetical protein
MLTLKPTFRVGEGGGGVSAPVQFVRGESLCVGGCLAGEARQDALQQ